MPGLVVAARGHALRFDCKHKRLEEIEVSAACRVAAAGLTLIPEGRLP
jgi:hypothetical protein